MKNKDNPQDNELKNATEHSNAEEDSILAILIVDGRKNQIVIQSVSIHQQIQKFPIFNYKQRVTMQISKNKVE